MGFFDYPADSSSVAETPTKSTPETFTFLERLPKDAWEKILAIVEIRQFRTGDDLIRMGERDDSFYILSAGSVSVVVPDDRGRDTVIAEIPEGSVFGEMSFFTSEPRSATIRALKDGSAIRITRTNFEHLGAWHPLIARQMMFDLARILALRLRWTSARIKK